MKNTKLHLNDSQEYYDSMVVSNSAPNINPTDDPNAPLICIAISAKRYDDGQIKEGTRPLARI